MKKLRNLAIVAIAATFVFSSCNSYKAKEVKLSNLNDSINYTLGLSNGDGIKNYYMQNDSSENSIKVFIEALDKAFKSEKKDDNYNLGMQIGSSFKQQKTQGLMGDSTLKFNEKLVRQGMLNAMKGFKGGMTPEEADEYIRKVMMEIQNKKMGAAPEMNFEEEMDSTESAN